MVSFSGMPSASSMFQAYASMSASVTLIKTMVNQVVPHSLQHRALTKFFSYFQTNSSKTVLIIEEKDGMSINEVYNAAETYLSTKTSPDFQRFKISKRPKEPSVSVKFANCGKIVDSFEEIELVWKFVHEAGQKGSRSAYPYQDDDCERGGGFSSSEKRYFELSFTKEHKDTVINCYIPFVLKQAKQMSDEKKFVKLHSLAHSPSYGHGKIWDSVNLEHPSTFETLALEPELKNAIIEDLDRFLKRKEFYRHVGKAWKRGYLLYGPPGTGKSSLIAAMANYLKFDIYDLEFSNVRCDSDLRRLLLSTKNRSILVIEDIDCSVELPDRNKTPIPTNNGPGRYRDQQFTLAGFLNVIDGLWSSCGDERVIIFTTNHKEKLDSALLRPGRMDMHIHMSYLTSEGFKILAANYLGINDPNHGCCQEIHKLIEGVQVSPAEIAEELMKSEDADVCLGNVVNFLKRKRISTTNEENKGEIKENGNGEIDAELQKVKRSKTLTA